MKKLLLILLITPTLAQDLTEDSLQIQDSWFDFDKVRHTTFSFLLVLSVQYIAVNKFDFNEQKAFPISLLSTASIGLLKEIRDEKKTDNHFCKRDLIANGIGLLLASVVVFSHFE